ncbi:hypothetical protein BKI52_27935 [marine bacterium AO1-C]|nr:hypothetical protein BKI52_27935 [marine bacterium AO1-C]
MSLTGPFDLYKISDGTFLMTQESATYQDDASSGCKVILRNAYNVTAIMSTKLGENTLPKITENLSTYLRIPDSPNAYYMGDEVALNEKAILYHFKVNL